jgi:hypothetical protein
MHLTRQCSILLVAMGAVVLLVLRMMRSDEDDTNSSGAAYPAPIVTPLLKELVLCLVPSDDFMYCTSRRRNDSTGVRVD